MCDLRTFNKIEKIVEQKMAAGQMFTAFDITLALQQKGVSKLHREIRNDTKRVADNLMWRFAYERTPVSFQEIGAQALVYHPYGTDASLHSPSVRPRVLAPTKIQKRILAEGNGVQPGQSNIGVSFCGYWKDDRRNQTWLVRWILLITSRDHR